MNQRPSLLIASDEWRYWKRSKLGVSVVIAALGLVIAAVVSTSFRISAEHTERTSFQQTATETFLSQPARHPHRMVHYGHYVLRSPAPLALVDPGVDAFSGTIMFLEGHRQNSAVFSPRYSAAPAGPFATLTPAFAYQVLVPLLLIVIGFSAVAREREAKTASMLMTSSVTAFQLWCGKTLALIAIALVSLMPLAFATLYSIVTGESVLIGLLFMLGYALYLICWCFLISGFSSATRRSANALAYLLAVWVVLAIIVPRFAATIADVVVPVSGKIVNDLALLEDVRQVGDGHNANDPAFARLRDELLEQYNVNDIAELPINFRGVVASNSEAKLTSILTEYAEKRMAEEAGQVKIMHALGALSPTLAARSFSMVTANTDLRQYHKFLRDAEALRFDFVQKLNGLHIKELSYANDVNRGASEEASQQARVSASNWRVLDNFAWQAGSVSERLQIGLPHAFLLLAWCVVTGFLSSSISQRSLRNHDG
ncbi:MAG: DUF3526 domain-containing protein [Pseudomonadota bacterium]